LNGSFASHTLRKRGSAEPCFPRSARIDGGHGQAPKNHPFRSSTLFGIDNDGAISSGLNRAQAEIG
jgi:hypothetical protein